MVHILDTKSKYWVFTDFNLTHNYEKLITSHKTVVVPTYFIFGKEICPTTSRKHYQGYIEFDKQISGRAMVRMWPGIHIEGRKGTALEAADYCRKISAKHPEWVANTEVEEWGNISISEQGFRTDLEIIKDMVTKDGKQMHEIIPMIKNLQQLNFAERLQAYNPKVRDWIPEIYWYYGPTGAGKTRAARAEAAAYEDERTWKSMNDLKNWQGYTGQENVIFDDFRGSFCQFHELLTIAGSEPLEVNKKYGSVQLLFKRAWFTSPVHPMDVYQTVEDKSQFLRRISKIVYFDVDGSRRDMPNNWEKERDRYIARKNLKELE